MASYLEVFTYIIALGVPTGLAALITAMQQLVVAFLSWPFLKQASQNFRTRQ